MTTNPTGLLHAIKDGIKDESIVTWSCDSKGDFTHTPDQWKKKALLRPEVNTTDNRLEFHIIWPEGQKRNNKVYGVYHGRFIEMVLAHFPQQITLAAAKP